MSDIVKLTSNGCQVGCVEDQVRVQTAETPSPLMLLHPKVRGANAPDQGAAVTTGFGI
jgi:hypothetical protein